jgi:hypothetical protein
MLTGTQLWRLKAPATAVLSALVFYISAAAAAEVRRPRVLVSEADRILWAEESKEIGDAVRHRDEARQAVWDRKMRTITRDVCVGC